MEKAKEIIINGLLYHRYRFGWKNIKVWFCRVFGHQISNKVNIDNFYTGCCQRCGLAYEEIYYKQLQRLSKIKEDKEKESYRFLEGCISVNPLYWTKIKYNTRACGNTTNIVNTIIEKLFTERDYEVLIVDHYNNFDSNQRLKNIVVNRLLHEYNIQNKDIINTPRLGIDKKHYYTIKLKQRV